jgi:hypothetical protein
LGTGKPWAKHGRLRWSGSEENLGAPTKRLARPSSEAKRAERKRQDEEFSTTRMRILERALSRDHPDVATVRESHMKALLPYERTLRTREKGWAQIANRTLLICVTFLPLPSLLSLPLPLPLMGHAGVRRDCNESSMLKRRLSSNLVLYLRILQQHRNMETQDKTSMLDPCTYPR